MTVDLLPVPFEPLWGYLDRKANLAIPPRFTWAGDFSCGLALVNEGGQPGFRNEMVGGKWGYIDPAGKYVFAAKFDKAAAFSEGIAVVNVGARVQYAPHEEGYYSAGGKFGYIDTTGKWLVQPCYTQALDMREGLAAVSSGNKTGYIDATGQFVIEPIFDSGHLFCEGYAVVSVGPEHGYINRSGDFPIPPKFSFASSFSDGIAHGLIAETYTDVFFDHTGAELFRAPENTIHAGNFSHSLCYAALGKIERFKDGKLYPMGRLKNYGYLDRSGNWSIQPQYDFASDFSEGMAWVRVEDRQHLYINRNGEPLNGKLYEEAGTFRNGLALVRTGAHHALIDRDGSTVWEY